MLLWNKLPKLGLLGRSICCLFSNDFCKTPVFLKQIQGKLWLYEAKNPQQPLPVVTNINTSM